MDRWRGGWAAVALSSLVFGLTHLINSQGTVEGALFIAVEAGVSLAAAYQGAPALRQTSGAFRVCWGLRRDGFSGNWGASGRSSGNAAS